MVAIHIINLHQLYFARISTIVFLGKKGIYYIVLLLLLLDKYFQLNLFNMSDDDYAIETTDAGASATIPMEAGQIKKGG